MKPNKFFIIFLIFLKIYILHAEEWKNKNIPELQKLEKYKNYIISKGKYYYDDSIDNIGKARKKALSNALSLLTNRLQVNVKKTTNTEYLEIKFNEDRTYIKDYLNEKLNIKSNLRKINFTILEENNYDGIYQVLIGINKKKLAKQYYNEIRNTLNKIATTYNTAVSLNYENAKFRKKALKKYKEVKLLIYQFYGYISIYDTYLSQIYKNLNISWEKVNKVTENTSKEIELLSELIIYDMEDIINGLLTKLNINDISKNRYFLVKPAFYNNKNNIESQFAKNLTELLEIIIGKNYPLQKADKNTDEDDIKYIFIPKIILNNNKTTDLVLEKKDLENKYSHYSLLSLNKKTSYNLGIFDYKLKPKKKKKSNFKLGVTFDVDTNFQIDPCVAGYTIFTVLNNNFGFFGSAKHLFMIGNSEKTLADEIDIPSDDYLDENEIVLYSYKFGISYNILSFFQVYGGGGQIVNNYEEIYFYNSITEENNYYYIFKENEIFATFGFRLFLKSLVISGDYDTTDTINAGLGFTF